MNQTRDPLDRLLEQLPRAVAPERDLWAGIHEQLEREPRQPEQGAASSRVAPTRYWMRLAAGLLLVVASSAITFVLTQQAARKDVQDARQAAARQLQQAPVLPAMPASFGGGQLGKGYTQARVALDAEFKRHLASLPPVTRAKLERSLADLRRAASEISSTLAQHPNDPLLQELLLSTYQSELALLGSVGEMTVPTLAKASGETRL